MEKTFEELIADKAYFNRWLKELTESETELIKDLMQQVREATKAEVTQIAKEDFGIGSGRPFIKHINNIPTDRIRIEP